MLFSVLLKHRHGLYWHDRHGSPTINASFSHFIVMTNYPNSDVL